jgi:hypothetical protein
MILDALRGVSNINRRVRDPVGQLTGYAFSFFFQEVRLSYKIKWSWFMGVSNVPIKNHP